MKLVLDKEELTSYFFEDCRLLGIMAPIKDYQFCWHVNNILGMQFRVNNEIEIQLKKKKRDYFFSVFEFPEELTALAHYVYNNKFDGEYLLPEFRHLDFLWLLKGDESKDERINDVIEAVRSIPSVQLVVELTNEKIKNKEHLVF
ncbi:MAG: IPExxxVDY family protein [Chitinophagaceae bacterium]|nr:IPExxxVDY family protein [Chitinophagaceae bacterium]